MVPGALARPLARLAGSLSRRLGRGGGYYDRFLARLRRGTALLGIAFDRQIVDAVPTEPHDVPVDCVITERRVTATRSSGTRS